MHVLTHNRVDESATRTSTLHQLEAAFAQMVGTRNAVAVDSYTTALRLALEAAGVQQGDEVITSPYNSWKAAEAICSLGARPVFVDVEEYSLNINSRLVAGAVSGKTKAILAVHTAGLPADIPTIHQIASMHELRVIEDAAYAFPAEYRGTMVGGASDVTCFGLHEPRNSAAPNGGILCTNNTPWAEQCRLNPHRMSDALAAAGLEELAQVEAMWTRRTEIARMYNQAFAEMPELQIPADRFDCEHAWHLYMLRLNPDRLRIDRARVVEELKKRNVAASVDFIPLHIHPFSRGMDFYKLEECPVAYREYLREVSLPIHGTMSNDDADSVIGAVNEVVKLGWGNRS